MQSHAIYMLTAKNKEEEEEETNQILQNKYICFPQNCKIVKMDSPELNEIPLLQPNRHKNFLPE